MAMYNLGIIYKNGASWHCAGRVRVDRAKARRLLERALALGERNARDALREMDEDVPNCGIVAKVFLFLACWAVWKPNLQPDFNVRVIERFGPDSSTALQELDESNRFVKKSAESTSNWPR